MLVAGCVATPVPGWVEDMRGPVAARTIALAGAAAERAAHVPIDARAEGDLFLLRSSSDPDRAPLGVARTFVGFGAGSVATCFAVCVAPSADVARGCDGAVRAARLSGDAPPPRPGFGLRSAAWAVHHPREAGLGFAGAVGLFGALAVMTRRKPRSYGASP